jgi:hypothetical protein
MFPEIGKRKVSSKLQDLDLASTPPENRIRLDPGRLASGRSLLAPYLDLWREARAGDAYALLSRIQARGLERRVMVVDYDRAGSFVYRFFGSGLTFVDAAARAQLIGKPTEVFGDLHTVLTAREGYLTAVGSDGPFCELVDRPRFDASGRPLPRTPFRRLVLPVPVNARVTRAIVASELILRPESSGRR